jgi:hypothetical protein
VPFTPVYLLDDEWALEVANRTVHGVMHLGWVPDGSGGYRGELAMLAKPNGRLGKGYLFVVRPLRHRIIYPSALRRIAREWHARADDTAQRVTAS